jgi:hypothetical protein
MPTRHAFGNPGIAGWVWNSDESMAPSTLSRKLLIPAAPESYPTLRPNMSVGRLCLIKRIHSREDRFERKH